MGQKGTTWARAYKLAVDKLFSKTKRWVWKSVRTVVGRIPECGGERSPWICKTSIHLAILYGWTKNLQKLSKGWMPLNNSVGCQFLMRRWCASQGAAGSSWDPCQLSVRQRHNSIIHRVDRALFLLGWDSLLQRYQVDRGSSRRRQGYVTDHGSVWHLLHHQYCRYRHK